MLGDSSSSSSSSRDCSITALRIVVTLIVFLITYKAGIDTDGTDSTNLYSRYHLGIYSGGSGKVVDGATVTAAKCRKAVSLPAVVVNVDMVADPCDKEEEEEGEEGVDGGGNRAQKQRVQTSPKQAHGHGQKRGTNAPPPTICSHVSTSSTTASSGSDNPSSNTPRQYLNSVHSYLHAWQGDAAAEVFNWLHNPASPAKFSYMLTSSEQWDANNEYTAIEVSKDEAIAEAKAGRCLLAIGTCMRCAAKYDSVPFPSLPFLCSLMQ